MEKKMDCLICGEKIVNDKCVNCGFIQTINKENTFLKIFKSKREEITLSQELDSVINFLKNYTS